jgi:hypothetical protein
MSPVLTLKPVAAPSGNGPLSAAAWLAANTVTRGGSQSAPPAQPASVATSATAPAAAPLRSIQADAREGAAHAAVASKAKRILANHRTATGQKPEAQEPASAPAAISSQDRWAKANARTMANEPPATKAQRILAAQAECGVFKPEKGEPAPSSSQGRRAKANAQIEAQRR